MGLDVNELIQPPNIYRKKGRDEGSKILRQRIVILKNYFNNEGVLLCTGIQCGSFHQRELSKQNQKACFRDSKKFVNYCSFFSLFP